MRSLKCATARIKYSVNTKVMKGRHYGTLTDRGANGCIIGRDMLVYERTEKFIDLTGIEDHTVQALNIIHAVGVMESHLGPVIAHVHQGAYMPDGKTILSPIQMEAYGCTVVDKAKGVNDGVQPTITSREGYHFPLAMRHGLMYVDVRPPLKEEWDRLPHVYLTKDQEWDPRIYDHEVDPDWKSHVEDKVEEIHQDLPYNERGTMDLEEDDEGFTRQDMMDNVAASIEDELLGSVSSMR